VWSRPDSPVTDDQQVRLTRGYFLTINAFIRYKYRYPYGTDFGGVTMMSSQNYSTVNGHTNVFWGWGREDSDIEHRIHTEHMKIEKPEIFDSGTRELEM
jgi:hypothetical protein